VSSDQRTVGRVRDEWRVGCVLLPGVLGRKLARDANPATVLSQVSRIRIQLNLRRLVAGLS